MYMSKIWKKYHQKTKNNPPRKLLIEALTFLESRKSALDLGAGALADSKYLLEQGFAVVTAVDKEALATEKTELPQSSKFEYVILPFEEFNFTQDAYDLVNAQFSLPFIIPEVFESVFANICSSLCTDGIFTGQLFGDRDEWNTNINMTFHQKQKAKDLFTNFELIAFTEKEHDSKTALGLLKHWHIYNFIARKKI